MAETPPLSPKDPQIEHFHIVSDKENTDSPLIERHIEEEAISSSQKLRKAPTVTPRRFKKFFTPRSTRSSRGSRQSKSARHLHDITKNGANRRKIDVLNRDDDFEKSQSALASLHPIKRRKLSTDLSSLPPLSSPLKHIETGSPIAIWPDEPSSLPVSEDELLPASLERYPRLPPRIRRADQSGSSRRVLERSFGEHGTARSGFRSGKLGIDFQAETAHFASTLAETHDLTSDSLAFCALACNTNSLLAIGEEDGHVRLIDTSKSSDFTESYLSFRPHNNAIMDMAFSSDDYLLATGSGDQTVRIVDMRTQQTTVVMDSFLGSVKQVQFYPGNDHMVTTSTRDGYVQLYDTRTSVKEPVQQVVRTYFAGGLHIDTNNAPRTCVAKSRIDAAARHVLPQRLSQYDRCELSITAIQHLSHGREHLILSASEASAKLNLWDLRFAHRRREPLVSSTPGPDFHRRTRDYGINALVMSGDGGRVYALCRDESVYAYSTNHLALGCAPETPSATTAKHRLPSRPVRGVAPLYRFKHPQLCMNTFYVKAALRPARGDQGEMLAVGNSNAAPILFPTDERHLRLSWNTAGEQGGAPLARDASDADLPSLASSQASTFSGAAVGRSDIPVAYNGTPLIRGHNMEVTSLTWTHGGDLVTAADDWLVRCWRANPDKARELRQGGEAGGQRWACGWADVSPEWDEEEC